MKTSTLICSRQVVEAVFSNARRALLLDDNDSIKVGDVVRLVSDETDIRKRIDCLRIATDRAGAPTGIIVSLRPLIRAEKDALFAEGAQ